MIYLHEAVLLLPRSSFPVSRFSFLACGRIFPRHDDNSKPADPHLPTVRLPDLSLVRHLLLTGIRDWCKVILTHQDLDHIGGLPEILRSSDHKVEVLAHKEEKPYIQGEKPLIKLNPEQMAKRMKSLPEELRKQMEKFFEESLSKHPDPQIRF